MVPLPVRIAHTTPVAFTAGTATTTLTTTLYRAQSGVTLRAAVAGVGGTNVACAAFTVNPGVPDHLTLVAPAGPQVAGATFPFTSLTSNDQWGNTATAYTGTHTVAYAQSGTPNAPDGAGVGTDSYTTSVHFTLGVADTALNTILYRAQTAKTFTADAGDDAHVVANVATGALQHTARKS